MNHRMVDGSAGDADYGVIGVNYAEYRRPEPAIERAINKALGHARLVLNVGAGTGSYEPRDRDVTAVEPSASMRSQRPQTLPAAIDAVAESLPFADKSFDASMTTFSVHQWKDVGVGLREMRRVTRGPVLIVTCDPLLVQRFWLDEYAPEVLRVESRRYPAIDRVCDGLGGRVRVDSVHIPLHCKDGFNEAYYGRPEMLLREGARTACSAWSFVEPTTVERYVDHLRKDLESGRWDRRHGALRSRPEYDGSLRLIVSDAAAESLPPA